MSCIRKQLSFLSFLTVENTITSPLPPDVTCDEEKECIFNISVSDSNAAVYWFINDKTIGIYGNRTETKHDHSHGDHQLIIKKVEMTDKFVTAVTPTNVGDAKINSMANLTVLPVEKPPVIKDVSTVPPCSVKDGCKILISYQHVGSKKSKLSLKCFKNSTQELVVNANFNVSNTTDTLTLAFTHPHWERSGEYRFVLTNDRGSDEETIQVTIIDRPSKPFNLTVFDIEHDSLNLKWQEPVLKHGSNITKYIIEVCS